MEAVMIILVVQEMEQSKAYQFGYELGYFVGSNFWEVLTAAILILAALLYLTIYRKKRKGV